MFNNTKQWKFIPFSNYLLIGILQKVYHQNVLLIKRQNKMMFLLEVFNIKIIIRKIII